MQLLGYNYRITDVQAALGISQLKRIDSFLKKRRTIAKQYDTALKNNPYFDTPPLISNTEHAYHLYPIRLKDALIPHKATLVQQLHAKGIGTQVHYIPVYRHPYYQQLGYKPGICPNAEMFYQRVLSIPMYPKLTTSDVTRVVKTLLHTCASLTKS